MVPSLLQLDSKLLSELMKPPPERPRFLSLTPEEIVSLCEGSMKEAEEQLWRQMLVGAMATGPAMSCDEEVLRGERRWRRMEAMDTASL